MSEKPKPLSRGGFGNVREAKTSLPGRGRPQFANWGREWNGGRTDSIRRIIKRCVFKC